MMFSEDQQSVIATALAESNCRRNVVYSPEQEKVRSDITLAMAELFEHGDPSFNREWFLRISGEEQ